MSGFSGGVNNGGNEEKKTGTAPRKPMGIQFVKSSESLNPSSESTSHSYTLPVSSSNSLLPTSVQNFNASSSQREGFNQPRKPSFGSPAVNFGHRSSNNSSNRLSEPPKYSQAFVKSGETYSSLKGGISTGGLGYRMPGFSNLKTSPGSSTPTLALQKVDEAKPLCTVEQYLKAWKEEKDPMVHKLRKLAYEVVTLKSDRPNAKDKLHSAANRVPLRIEFNIKSVLGVKNCRSFLCFVYIENVKIASGQGSKIKDSKTNAYEAALQKILMPHLRIIPTDPTSKELQVSKLPFTSPPPEPSKVHLHNPITNGPKEVLASQHKESNLETAGLKRRYNEFKPLDDFLIVEPKVPIPDCTPAHTLRRSADFNHMLLEYDYFFKGEAARCILKIENEVLADVNGVSKMVAKNTASSQALNQLKRFCWIIKTKKAVDSNTKISKEEIVNELNEQSESIDRDNIGNKMLRKMGWSGGGVGKDGSGIAEPVSLKSVLNREGLGLSESKGITNEFRKRIKEVIENYVASSNQEDLVFSCDFRLEERQIIHDECRRLNLRSKSRGKGVKRYLCVRRKRSVNELFDHLMSVGGETARYQLVPPGQNDSSNIEQPQQLLSNSNPPKVTTGMGMLSSSTPQSLLEINPCWQGESNFTPQDSHKKVASDLTVGNQNVASHHGGSFSRRSHDNGPPYLSGSSKVPVGQQNNNMAGGWNDQNKSGHFLQTQTPLQNMGPLTQQNNGNAGGAFGNDFGGGMTSTSSFQAPGCTDTKVQNSTGNSLNSGFQNNAGRAGNFSFGNNSNDYNNEFSQGGSFGRGGLSADNWIRPLRPEFSTGCGRALPQQHQNSVKQSGGVVRGNSSGMMNSFGSVRFGSAGGSQMMANNMGESDKQGERFFSRTNNPHQYNDLQRSGMGNQGWNPESQGQWGMGQNNGQGTGTAGGYNYNGHGGSNYCNSNNNISGPGMQYNNNPNEGYWGGGY